jgi:hypothetical protein
VKISKRNVIHLSDWNHLVTKTYGRPYNLQQQDDCRPCGSYISFTVPDEEVLDFDSDTVPEVINDPEQGVSFKAWLSRDPDAPVGGRDDDFGKKLWWHRNFYPTLGMVASDLHAKGLLPEGEYTILISW